LLCKEPEMTNENYKILLVDDEPDILEFVGYNLRKEGYHLDTASNGKEAIAIAKKEIPNLIIIDVMMPDMDGIETCREIRSINELKNVMIAFLTARNEDYSQIAGFEVGADDYINKPIKPRVLISRIKALLRRQSGGGNENSVKKVDLGGLEIDREKYVVLKEGSEINLPKKEFELLALLASKPGKVFTRDNILDQVWGGDVVVGDRTIDVHVRKLREKLGEEFIKTVKGIGYKFDF
jgi:two-component system alkaline phosphatase synthesis response regulator PhoP